MKVEFPFMVGGSLGAWILLAVYAALISALVAEGCNHADISHQLRHSSDGSLTPFAGRFASSHRRTRVWACLFGAIGIILLALLCFGKGIVVFSPDIRPFALLNSVCYLGGAALFISIARKTGLLRKDAASQKAPALPAPTPITD